MTREEKIAELINIRDNFNYTLAPREVFDDAIKALEQEPCEDAISRQAVCKIIDDIRDCVSVNGYWAFLERLKKLPPVNPQPKTVQFAKWVATEIFDDNWEYNKDAFAELACRKLTKLGIVRANGDEWELVEPQESEDKCKNCEYYRNPDYTRCHECEAESEG